MPLNLFALCVGQNGHEVRRVPVDQTVQNGLEATFAYQEIEFMSGKTQEIIFNGNWHPSDNEIITITDAALIASLTAIRHANPQVYPILDVSNYQNVTIKALFANSQATAGRILVQKFRVTQFLSRKLLTLVMQNNHFSNLDAHGFSLDSKLSAVIDADTLKFVSFQNVRTILDLSQYYQAATTAEVIAFRGHAMLDVANAAVFDANVDEHCRKLIWNITRSNALVSHTAQEISASANATGFKIGIANGKIVVPGDRKGLKALLSFLDDAVYKGPLSAKLYITNSKRDL